MCRSLLPLSHSTDNSHEFIRSSRRTRLCRSCWPRIVRFTIHLPEFSQADCSIHRIGNLRTAALVSLDGSSECSNTCIGYKCWICASFKLKATAFPTSILLLSLPEFWTRIRVVISQWHPLFRFLQNRTIFQAPMSVFLCSKIAWCYGRVSELSLSVNNGN